MAYRNTHKRNKRHSHTTNAILPLFIVVCAAGCIWATHKKDPAPEAQKIPSASTPAQQLQKVGMPDGIPSQIKDYEGFTISFNASNRTPNYVAWELLGSETTGTQVRTNRFWRDETIKNCPSSSDYTRSGFDRGHMFPAADAKWSAQAMEDCFSMANMCPQSHALNAGAWKTLEEKERLWAARDSSLIIIAGPLYQNDDKLRIGTAGIRVPSAFYKLIVAPYLPEPRGIAFVYPNDRCPGNMQNYVQTIDYVEQLTGFDFFNALPDDIESKIESQTSFKEWNRH